MGDYSTTITLINNTNATLGLTDYTAVEGHFAQGQPPNMIDAHTQSDIYIKDDFGTQGSHGRCTYELHFDTDAADVKSPTFMLDFGDPTGWNDNWLSFQTSSTDIVPDVRPYPQRGHPFHATVEIHTKANVTFATTLVVHSDNVTGQTSRTPAEDEMVEQVVATGQKEMPIRAMYHIGFKDPTGLVVDNKPIHESIAIAAFIRSNVYTPRGTEYGNLTDKQWEYIRGVIWNDDPSCLLFDDDSNNNHHFAVGIEWYEAFRSHDSRCMTRRSHFGDLQFLHAMATAQGEAAQTTKDNCLYWLEVMYKLACGNQGVSENDQLDAAFKGRFFTNTSDTPSSQRSLRDALLATTGRYGAVQIGMRALGTCLHVIADSYAHGHTRRTWLNPEDLDQSVANGEVRFKNGTYGRCGGIITFHTYDGQDEDKHKHYDMLIGEMPKPFVLDSFNKILGARDAIEKSTTLINFWRAKTAWEKGVEQFLRDDVFELDPNATPANAKVD